MFAQPLLHRLLGLISLQRSFSSREIPTINLASGYELLELVSLMRSIGVGYSAAVLKIDAAYGILIKMKPNEQAHLILSYKSTRICPMPLGNLLRYHSFR
jgi:hypothetical protein